MKKVSQLLELLKLERLETYLFRGDSQSIGSKRVFGGQVLAQSLSAAMQTVELDRHVHSLHAFFILPGDISKPIIFDVDPIRDGGSFTTRRVVAIQNGKAIFNMSASFQLRQEGFDHQVSMPKVTPPDELMNWNQMVAKYGKNMSDNFRKFLVWDRPLEFRPVENPFENIKTNQRNIWLRPFGEMPDDERSNSLVLAYASDYNLLTTSLLPHGQLSNFPDMTVASLDHAMWFHRPVQMNDWLLYSTDSPSASGGRGFTRGSIFDRAGHLVASVVQEGLIRPKRRG